MFAGSIPALVTPFRGGSVDEAALARLVDWQIAQGSSALVPCGTTGESATLGFDEHYRVFDVVIEGISYVRNYRTSFGEEIEREGKGDPVRGLDALIKRLETVKTESVKA